MQVSLHALHKQFGNLTVLDGVTTAFQPGGITVLLGENGAGKTTLLRCLTGLSSGNSGAVTLDGEELTAGRLDLRRRLMFLPDVPPAVPGSHVLEHVAMCLNLWHAAVDGVPDKVAAWLDELQLAGFAESPIDCLSRGQSYKAALLALLAVDPELWLLDEPFASGMDAGGLALFRREALAAADRGRTVIYSTQIVEIAAAFSTTVAILKKGVLTLYDTERDFARDPERIGKLVMTGALP